jgi:hypothetical protein
MYEHRTHHVLSWRAFLRRAGRHALVAFLILFTGVGLGTIGYRVLADLSWIDAFLNASMIASGMGPVDSMSTTSAKLFAAVYALFSGFIFVGVVGVALAPWVHRLFHKMHMEE